MFYFAHALCVQNLGRLVRQPSGCGEQNMVLFSPNIHVMKYLTAVGELTEGMKQKLTANMRTGGWMWATGRR